MGPVASLNTWWQLAHLLINKALPSCAEIFIAEKQKIKNTSSVIFLILGLLEIIVGIDLKNVDKNPGWLQK